MTMYVIYTYVDEDGDLIVKEAQGGIPLDYDEALTLKEELEAYLSLGKKTVNLLNSDALHEEANRRYEPIQVNSTPRDKSGYVYLLQSPNGLYKIGRTKDAQGRLKNFKTSMPFDVEFEHVIKTDDMYKLENELHERFSMTRVSGEWFRLTSNDIAYIKGL